MVVRCISTAAESSRVIDQRHHREPCASVNLAIGYCTPTKLNHHYGHPQNAQYARLGCGTNTEAHGHRQVLYASNPRQFFFHFFSVGATGAVTPVLENVQYIKAGRYLPTHPGSRAAYRVVGLPMRINEYLGFRGPARTVRRTMLCGKSTTIRCVLHRTAASFRKPLYTVAVNWVVIAHQ